MSRLIFKYLISLDMYIIRNLVLKHIELMLNFS